MNKHILTVAILTAGLPLGALAQGVPAAAAPVISVTDAYARSSNPEAGAAFMTIGNAGSRDCALSSVSAEGFSRPELHTSRDEGGVMKMVPLDRVTIPAGGSHELKRGGDHIMLMGARAPIMQGQEVSLSLDFGDCGTVPVSVTIDNNAGPAMGKGVMDGGMGGMSHMNHAGGAAHQPGN